jgi:hypothetical protein
MNDKILKNITMLKTIAGIDTLYYFSETNRLYPKLYEEIEKRLQEEKELIQIRGGDEYTSELTILIEEQPFKHLGKAEGYLWFVDLNQLFKIGFKDNESNTNLHDIRIQLLANGIYGVGMNDIIQYIDTFLQNYTTGYKPITRADLNSFVQLDLSFIHESMFATRKRDIDIRKKIRSNSMQTIYVGKKPFLLRIYNKREELKNSYKERMMKLYFLENGFSYDKPIFNVEFELHRQFLRTYKIDTVDDLLTNAVSLFGECIDAIRLVDNDTVTATNRYRAQTHPIWKEVKSSYRLDRFVQSSDILEKLRRKPYIYELEEFEKEFKALTKRGYLNSLPISIDLMKTYYEEMKNSL